MYAAATKKGPPRSLADPLSNGRLPRSERSRRNQELGGWILAGSPPGSLGRCVNGQHLFGSKRSRRRNLADPVPEEFCRTDVTERRDWPNLVPDLVEDIAGRLLSLGVAEYLRFRAACKGWRQVTVDPVGTQDRRFRPRDWIVLSHCAAGTTRRRLLNLATGARADVDLPALSTHHHLHSADGLLVVCDRATEAMRLLSSTRSPGPSSTSPPSPRGCSSNHAVYHCSPARAGVPTLSILP
uniref:F-box domain-containing protein n=1 Tax=Arundo donax TaxID=35708 RepID=A0A0A9CXS3_ARUDO